MTSRGDFVELLLRAGALTFGDFTTKSGRRTPFFIDTGKLRTGAQITALGRHYATAIAERFGDGFDVLFGPAYKGIPLVVTAAVQLYALYGIDRPFCFNRKETKDHGEGGALVGQVPRDGDRVVVVEDVITAGTSIRETIPLLRAAARVKVVGLVVAVDRMERGAGGKRALDEVREFGFPAFPIVTLKDVVSHLRGRSIDGRGVLDAALEARIDAYLEEHGPLEEGGPP